jgi:hypothetical protein
MGRLIIVPQYPTKLRYQEWWINEFQRHFNILFGEVVTLGYRPLVEQRAQQGSFAPGREAIKFETEQINEFMEMKLRDDDILLLNDLSYPGLFAHVLFHKRPKKCFAICHATSKNRFDIFADDRKIKYPIERKVAELFDDIFVASAYHVHKLGWKNLRMFPFPYPPFEVDVPNSFIRVYPIISVARDSKQKRSVTIEKEVERSFKCKILHPKVFSWNEYYYEALGRSKVMLITAKEETFGYQVLDAVLAGCIPVAPNHFSYPELIPKEYLYNNLNELFDILIKALSGRLPVPKLLTESNSLKFYQYLTEHMTK